MKRTTRGDESNSGEAGGAFGSRTAQGRRGTRGKVRIKIVVILKGTIAAGAGTASLGGRRTDSLRRVRRRTAIRKRPRIHPTVSTTHCLKQNLTISMLHYS